jgi:hypothetical protein
MRRVVGTVRNTELALEAEVGERSRSPGRRRSASPATSGRSRARKRTSKEGHRPSQRRHVWQTSKTRRNSSIIPQAVQNPLPKTQETLCQD